MMHDAVSRAHAASHKTANRADDAHSQRNMRSVTHVYTEATTAGSYNSMASQLHHQMSDQML